MKWPSLWHREDHHDFPQTEADGSSATGQDPDKHNWDPYPYIDRGWQLWLLCQHTTWEKQIEKGMIPPILKEETIMRKTQNKDMNEAGLYPCALSFLLWLSKQKLS